VSVCECVCVLCAARSLFLLVNLSKLSSTLFFRLVIFFEIITWRLSCYYYK